MPQSSVRRAAGAFALLVAAGALSSLPLSSAYADPVPTNVTVNTRAGLATVADTALGVNHAIWDSELGTTAVSDLLGAAGVGMVRYPGGSYADIYHWQTHTAPGGYVAPNTDFDTFMAGAKRIGAQPMIIANYGTGTAQEAADWVRYANITKGYHANWWTIGNENYGNGHYGTAWEADDHADKSPKQYAEEVVAYSQAMKAVDPNIKIGAVLTTPANWPDALVGGGDAGSWNQVVLSIAGPSIDFVDLHWYPGGNGEADALTKPGQIDDIMYVARDQIAKYAGAGSGRIGISLTETNVGVGQNTQPGALFLAQTYSAMIENGVFTVDWWDVHNGIGTVSTVAGQTDYGDFGMLSSGNCTSDGTVCEPAKNTPFAPYHALKLMHSFARPGDQLIRAGTDDPLVAAHAARRANGDLTLLLVNMDPANSHAVKIAYDGYTPSSAAPAVESYLNGASGITSAQTGTAAAQTLAPYSLTVLTLHPATSQANAPKAPGRPSTTAVTDRTATLTWPASQAGVKYEVYRQVGARSEQLGETTSTSYTAGNLTPGTRYTINIVARDGSGRASWSSPPLTFRTGAPATSTCSVKFADANDWGNGYVGNIDITNTGTAAINNWTLTFSWPTGWQSLSSGWNGTWTQTGATVRVTPADFNTNLAPGATTSIGFVGAYSGPNILPAAFTLNGNVCSAG
ncbi:cellulose binding domain-containing protein [Dactylosporangium sp. NPDC049140]|uniref:cellulose binding domain-containing protein n=1 Tax=Dactylosporangium sp. NPDC049140 TaxID=3155647 RepID=UPI0033D9761A